MTPYTHYVLACIPAPDSPAAHEGLTEDSSPAGERFWGYDQPTHIDADGTEWVVIRTWCRPEKVEKIAALADTFPDAEYAVTRERVPEAAPDDTVTSHPDHGAFVVVQRDDPPPVLDGLERIEPQSDDPLL